MPAFKPRYEKGRETFISPMWKIQFLPNDDYSWLKIIVVSTRGYNEQGVMVEAVTEGNFSSEEEASPLFSEMEAKQWIEANPDFPEAKIVYYPGH